MKNVKFLVIIKKTILPFLFLILSYPGVVNHEKGRKVTV